jgi:hypothetical protein
MGDQLVRKIEIGLKRGWWLSRKLKNTVLMLELQWSSGAVEHENMITAAGLSFHQ